MLQSELKDYSIIVGDAEDVRPSSKRRSDFPQLFLPLLILARPQVVCEQTVNLPVFVGSNPTVPARLRS